MKWKKIGLILFITLPIFIPLSTSSNGESQLFNMSYIFLGNPNSHINQVNKTQNSLDVVSPNYFDINEDGELKETWTLSSMFISEMHKRGIKVVPFLANHWDATAGINGLNNRKKLAKDVAAAVKKYNLDGVNVDIEGVNHLYRDAHTDFIRLLREYIPKEKEVSVAVAANPNGWNTGWHGFYDYHGLGKYADYLMIMAYDESWEAPDSPIGPVSSIQFFERSIQYAIKKGVPKNKIVAGLPFYGRLWKLDGPTLEGKSLNGFGLSATRVEPLVDKFNGKIQFDENTKSSFATFTIPKGQNAFVGSTNLTAGNYIIWYDNEPTIRAKLRLPKEYGIKGTGSWALYHETPDTWNYYTSALNWSDTKAQEVEKTVIESGLMAKTNASNVNLRSSASLSGAVKRKLSTDTTMKITGDSVTFDNYKWVPVQLLNGEKGYIASNYINPFRYNELMGKNRYDTSVNISEFGWKENADAVVLGRGDVPVDALTGSVLANKFKSPLLLTTSSKLPDNVKAEIERLSPKTIYILGGEVAISRTVEQELKSSGYNVMRISGKNRYNTAMKIANNVGINQEIFLTTGNESPDALSIAPYAGMKQIPILLTQPNKLSVDVKNAITSNGIKKVTIIGGEVAVSKKVENELRKLGIGTIERISGQNRYETSVEIAKRYKSELDYSEIFFASGTSYIDALPGSPLAAMKGSPIILVNNGKLHASIQDFLNNEVMAIPDITIFGGYQAIPESTRIDILD